MIQAGAVGLEGGVGLNGFAGCAAEQLPRGFTGGFAADIPQSHVDGSNGIDDRAPSAVHAAADVEFLPKAFGIERIFADEHFLQAKAHGVGAWGLDAGSGDPRVDVAFSDACDAFVGVDKYDDVVLCRGGGVGADVRDEQNVALDVGNLHLAGHG